MKRSITLLSLCLGLFAIGFSAPAYAQRGRPIGHPADPAGGPIRTLPPVFTAPPRGAEPGRGVEPDRGRGTEPGRGVDPNRGGWHGSPTRVTVPGGTTVTTPDGRNVYHPGGLPEHRPGMRPDPRFGGRPYPVAVVSPYRWHPSNCGYYGGYWFGGVYSGGIGFFAFGAWVPTYYVYYPAYGYTFVPVTGVYIWSAPAPGAMITVAVEETVLMPDGMGGYITETVTYYYNAFWDPYWGAYTYVDYQGITHYLR